MRIYWTVESLGRTPRKTRALLNNSRIQIDNLFEFYNFDLADPGHDAKHKKATTPIVCVTKE